MKLTNNQIYSYATNLALFGIEQKLPIRINFFLQKNIQVLLALAQDIDNSRLEIAKQYGALNEDSTAYSIPDDKIELVASELNDLFNLEQDVNIRKFNINDFTNIDLTYKQMSALMFMMEE